MTQKGKFLTSHHGIIRDEEKRMLLSQCFAGPFNQMKNPI
ncbi:DUF4049 domain-containing protein [Escherichia coli]